MKKEKTPLTLRKYSVEKLAIISDNCSSDSLFFEESLISLWLLKFMININ